MGEPQLENDKKSTTPALLFLFISIYSIIFVGKIGYFETQANLTQILSVIYRPETELTLMQNTIVLAFLSDIVIITFVMGFLVQKNSGMLKEFKKNIKKDDQIAEIIENNQDYEVSDTERPESFKEHLLLAEKKLNMAKEAYEDRQYVECIGISDESLEYYEEAIEMIDDKSKIEAIKSDINELEQIKEDSEKYFKLVEEMVSLFDSGEKNFREGAQAELEGAKTTANIHYSDALDDYEHALSILEGNDDFRMPAIFINYEDFNFDKKYIEYLFSNKDHYTEEEYNEITEFRKKVASPTDLTSEVMEELRNNENIPTVIVRKAFFMQIANQNGINIQDLGKGSSYTDHYTLEEDMKVFLQSRIWQLNQAMDQMDTKPE